MLSVKREEEIRNSNLDKDGQIFCHECVELLAGLTSLRKVHMTNNLKKAQDPSVNFKQRLFHVKGHLYLMRAKMNELNCLHALPEPTCARCVMVKMISDVFIEEDKFYGMR